MLTLRLAVRPELLKRGIKPSVLLGAARNSSSSKQTTKEIGSKTSRKALGNRHQNIASRSVAQSALEESVAKSYSFDEVMIEEEQCPPLTNPGLESSLSNLDPTQLRSLDDLKRLVEASQHRLEFVESVNELGQRAVVGRVYDPSKEDNNNETTTKNVAEREEYSSKLLDKMSRVVRTKPDLVLSRDGGWGGIWFTEKELEHLKKLNKRE